MENKRKRILFVIDWYLPGYKAGGPTRSMANICEHIRDKFDIYIITRNTDYMDNIPYDKILTNQWNTLGNKEHIFYSEDSLISKHFYVEIMKSMNFDAIYIHGIFSWKFSILPLIAANSIKHKKIIVAPRGMLANSALFIKSFKKRLFLSLAKIFGLYCRVSFHATNEQDKIDIKRTISDKVEIIVADNLPRKTRSNYLPLKKEKGEVKLFSLSRIAREKNILFAINILSRIKRADLKIDYYIYGQIYDKGYWAECLDMIRRLPSNIRVSYNGTVSPDKLDEVIYYNHCLFMPTLGENYGHAILETISSGRPVLISDKTQWKELCSCKAGWNISLTDHEEFAGTIIKLAEMEQEEFNKWCDGAKISSEKFVNNNELIGKYEEMFDCR